MGDGFLKLFKYNIPNQKRAFKKCIEIPEYRKLSYRSFKTKNIELDILSNYIACLRFGKEELDKGQVQNLFRYLAKNIHGSNTHDVKKVMFRLYDLETLIANEITDLEKENNTHVIQNLDMLLHELKVLKKIIIDGAKDKSKNLEKEIQFEALARQLIYPTTYEDSILTTLYYNSGTLNNSPNNSRVFSDLFYKAILDSNVKNDFERKKYYRLLGNYIMETNLLRLDKKIINILGLRKESNRFTSSLDQKIKKMEKDEKTGRYYVDDYIVTFDNNTTSRYDDALSIEQTPTGSYILGIHIADVHALNLNPFIRENPKDALEYKSKCSLKEFCEKNAISLFIEINQQGLIVDKSFLMTKVEVNNNLYYEDVPKLMNRKDDKNNPLRNTIVNLMGLYMIIKNDKLPVFPAPKDMAHSIVHKYMLLYGCIASKYAEEKNIPILFRGEDKYVSINKTIYDAGFNEFETYSRITSPIWDIEAEANQLALCECIFNKITNREKHNMKMNLLMASNHINNDKYLQE